MPEHEASPSNPTASQAAASESGPGQPTGASATGQAASGGAGGSRAATLGDVQAEADRLIKNLQADHGTEVAVYAVALLANRAAAELHRLAKAEATARKGTPEWGTWAALQNAARKLVLDSSTARDGAARLAGRPR